MRSFADIFYDCDYMLLSLLDMSLFDSAGASIPPELDESAAGALEGTLVDLLEAALEEDDFLAGDFFAAFLRGDDFFAAFFAPFFAAFFAPFLGAVMFLLFVLLVLGTLFFLVRRGYLGAPPWAAHRSPETEAKSILAERFARGDITTDEFMERASVLNWTPGSDAWEVRKGKKKGL